MTDTTRVQNPIEEVLHIVMHLLEGTTPENADELALNPLTGQPDAKALLAATIATGIETLAPGNELARLFDLRALFQQEDAISTV